MTGLAEIANKLLPELQALGELAETDNSVCRYCSGTGWEEVERGKGVRSCRCRVEIATARRWQDAAVPARYAEATLESFDVSAGTLTVRLAHQAVGAYLRDFAGQYGRGRGLLLVGNTGTGKTHLAVAVMRAVVGLGCTARFVDVGAFTEAVRDSFGEGAKLSRQQIVAPLRDADLVVLDDLGRDRPTEWQQSLIESLVMARYDEARPVIATSNYFLVAETGAVYGEMLSARVGARVESRLLEMCKVCKLIGPDYRRELAEREQAG